MRDTRELARITKELRDLSTQFRWSAFENSSPSDQTQILNGLLNGSSVEDLRITLDCLSQFLWSYIEFAAEESGLKADCATRELQNERLLRITEMLRLLHRSSCPSQDPLAFVERATRSVDRYLETAVENDLLCERRADDAGTQPVEEEPRCQLGATHGRSESWLFNAWH
jgi:hypothetical protein